MTESEQTIRLHTFSMKELLTLRKRLAGMVERYSASTSSTVRKRGITKARRLDQINRRIAQLESGSVVEEVAPVVDEKAVEKKREINRLVRERREAMLYVEFDRARQGDRFHTPESLQRFQDRVDAIDAKLAIARGEVSK
jgi:hypothetical protein